MLSQPRGSLAIIVLSSLLNSCYLLQQGMHIISLQVNAEDISGILQQDLNPELRGFLELVLEIKTYASVVIGLRDDANFTRYVEIDKEYLVDVVSASQSDAFAAFTWRYPFFGSFPYKGYFEYEHALKEAQRLKRKGLDTIVRRVDAFSTLGFFTDPVYSFMTDYSVFTLASLIIHEQTHATIFLKNQIQFNEELATFVGREGALDFIAQKYGSDAEQYRNALRYLKELDLFLRLIHDLYGQLDLLYAEDLSAEQKLHQRELVFESFRQSLQTTDADSFTTAAFGNVDKIPLNNAMILSLVRYTHDLSLFYSLYEKYEGDLANTVVSLIEGTKNLGDPKASLRELLAD